MNTLETNKERNDLYPFVSDQKEWLKENYFNIHYRDTNLTIEEVENLHPRDRFTFFELNQQKQYHLLMLKRQKNRLHQIRRQIRDMEMTVINGNENSSFKDYYPMTQEQYRELRDLKESWGTKK